MPPTVRIAPPEPTPPIVASRGSPDRLAVVDLLRIVAAAAVMWYHFGFRTRADTVRATTHWGFVGVQVFFVVSGFIIPFALARGGFSWPRDGWRFVLKRTLRLDPPYLLSSAIAALLLRVEYALLAPPGPPPTFPIGKSLAHLGYLNGVLGLGWYNGNCWTLGVECQFYLALVAALPLILSRRPATVFAFHAACLAASWAAVDRITGPATTHSPWLLQWLPVFDVGIAAFQCVAGLIGVPAFLSIAAAAGIVSAATGSPAGAVAAVAAGIAIALVRVPPSAMITRAAALTYSFYLLHEPIGSRAVSAVSRLGAGPLIDALALVAGVCSSLVAAWLLWRWVERPSLSWAAAIRYSGADASRCGTGHRHSAADRSDSRN